MKTIFNAAFYLLAAYAFVVLALMYGVAMGFVPSDSHDMLSQSVRFIFNLI